MEKWSNATFQKVFRKYLVKEYENAISNKSSAALHIE